MPSREIRTSRPGNIDWMPKYVSAAARSCRSSALYSFRARLAAASQDPPLRSVGSFGTSSRALLCAVCELAIGDHLPYLVGMAVGFRLPGHGRDSELRIGPEKDLGLERRSAR